MRVRNLFTPLTIREDISIKYLIFSLIGRENLLKNKAQNKNIFYKTLFYKPNNILSIFNLFLKSLLSIKQMKEKGNVNILYVYGYPNLKNIFIILFAKIFNYRILFDIVEDNFTQNDFRSLKGRINNYFSLIFIRKMWLFADGALAISHHLKELLNNISRHKFPIELIPISVDFSNFPSINSNTDDNIKFFYGGSFGEKDNIELLLDAFETVSHLFEHVKIIITGKGPVRHMDKLNKLIEKNSSKDKIMFKGFMPLKDYYNTLNDCDIMCIPRNNTAFANGGFPFKLGEYLASGKAVIASDVSDVKYYLKNEINAILIKPDSKDDLVKAMKTLISNKDLRFKIGEQGRETAKENFDNSTVTGNFISFIEKRILLR